ncbi:MAG: alanine racemase [Chthoniobacterales bacterium]
MAPFRTWVEINRSALRHNVGEAKRLASKAGIIAVLKANAYGHGLEEIATTLADDVAYFAVASLEEALRLRSVSGKIPIMLLSAALPSEYTEIARHGFIPTISSYEEALLFSKAAVNRENLFIHFKVDTGMGRLGVWYPEAEKILTKIKNLPLTVQSISTHLPSADSEVKFTRAQLALFKNLLHTLRRLAPTASVHALNSAGVLRFSSQQYDLVRVGLMLYGISPLPSFQKMLQPVMTWKATVSRVTKITKGSSISYGRTYKAPHDLTVAILPVGYADGYPRQLSGHGAEVLINGNYCPVLGIVTMDQIVVDVSRAGRVRSGSVATLLGKQKKEEITATSLAKKAGTISWHLFTGITERVHYVYCD